MCLIIYCPKNSDKQNPFLEEAIRKASEFNADGMGYAIKRADNSLLLDKGFFKVDDFIKSIKSREVAVEDELVIHLRIGNKGKVDMTMCHPFIISNDEEEIIQLEAENLDKPILVHNGTMHKHSVTNSDKSDTYYFIKNVLTNEAVLNFLKADVSAFDELLQAHLQKSRLVLMFPDNQDTCLLGEWKKEQDFYFSKDYFVEYFPKPKSNVNINNWTPNLIGYRSDDYYDDFDWDELEARQNGRNQALKSFATGIEIPKLIYPRPSFIDFLGTKHVLYMGLYFPMGTSLRPFSIAITPDNYDFFHIDLREYNAEKGLFTEFEYEIIDVTDSSIVIRNGFTMNSEVSLSHEEFYELFRYVTDTATTAFYEHYLAVLKFLNISKTTYNKFSKIYDRAVETDKNFVKYKGMDIDIDAASIWIQNAKYELDYIKHPEKLLF